MSDDKNTTIINSMRRINFCIIAVICLVLILLSCSQAEPTILFGFIESVYYQGKDKPEERFSFFVLSEDDDGIENLAELYLYNDREGLRWLIDSNDWIQHTEDEKTWIGSRAIAMFENTALPRGQYRAVLVNKGGERTERTFTFDGPEEPPHIFPVFTINSGVYTINSEYPVNHLICYDQQGNTVQTVTLAQQAGNLSELRLLNSARSAALWAEDPDYRSSALTEAVSLR